METIEFLSDYLRKIGVHNYLALGVAIIILWLFISGFRKGLRKKGRDEDTNHHEKNDHKNEET
jgi:hypothetical protein